MNQPLKSQELANKLFEYKEHLPTQAWIELNAILQKQYKREVTEDPEYGFKLKVLLNLQTEIYCIEPEWIETHEEDYFEYDNDLCLGKCITIDSCWYVTFKSSKEISMTFFPGQVPAVDEAHFNAVALSELGNYAKITNTKHLFGDMEKYDVHMGKVMCCIEKLKKEEDYFIIRGETDRYISSITTVDFF